MAGLPESPPINGRRLFEMLQEPQEPFVLEVYLLEKGYSNRLLSSQSTRIVCWPGKGCRRLQRLTTRHCKTWREVLLRNILNWVDKAPSNAAAFCLSEFGRKRSIGRELNRKHRRNNIVVGSKLQLQYSCDEVSAVCRVCGMEDNKSKLGFDRFPTKVVHLFNELYEVAYTPAFYQLLGSNMQLNHSDEKVSNSKEITEKLIHEKIPPRNQRRKYITNIEQLTVSELSSSSTEWSQFHHQIREIGIEIEAILYEDIEEEAIIDMLSSHCTFKMSPSSSSSTL
ncbi:hypothetical protein Cni_G19672 [Canna indica]|uniref:Uncharacterized protein n=1 Tax=Canna indica TaxID=4628 RepID=A0AAQ3KPX2_9LILI|nr:hypothetical protein Cni_G19672 [Canna indica]